MALEQTTKSVAGIIAKFTERALFYSQYAASKESKMNRYHDMLRTEIREFVSISEHKSLSSLVEAVRERELELETQ